MTAEEKYRKQMAFISEASTKLHGYGQFGKRVQASQTDENSPKVKISVPLTERAERDRRPILQVDRRGQTVSAKEVGA